MKTELIIDGNAVYEIDLECRQRKLEKRGISEMQVVTTQEFAKETCALEFLSVFLKCILLCILCDRLADI